jgi:hypothetical protein
MMLVIIATVVNLLFLRLFPLTTTSFSLVLVLSLLFCSHAPLPSKWLPSVDDSTPVEIPHPAGAPILCQFGIVLRVVLFQSHDLIGILVGVSTPLEIDFRVLLDFVPGMIFGWHDVMAQQFQQLLC